MKKLKLLFALGTTMAAMCAGNAIAQVTSQGGVTEYQLPSHSSATSRIDFDGAKPFPMPMLPSLPGGGQFENQAYGDNPWKKPYNTKRVATEWSGKPATNQPYAAAGKLYFTGDDGGSYTCSGALVATGLVVTAAHCVAPFGGQTFYSDFVFVPGKHFNTEPFGEWYSSSVVIKTVYYDGTDECYVPGVICRNDVAVLKLNPKQDSNGDDYYPGDSALAGQFGYLYNNIGFNGFKQALITQLGYPASHDFGIAMHETNSQSSQVIAFVDNNIVGSRQTGGSSGGPWLINHGLQGNISVPAGNWGKRNIIVGVTSWGYIADDVKIQGASKFTGFNVKSLVEFYCGTGSTARYCVE